MVSRAAARHQVRRYSSLRANDDSQMSEFHPIRLVGRPDSSVDHRAPWALFTLLFIRVRGVPRDSREQIAAFIGCVSEGRIANEWRSVED